MAYAHRRRQQMPLAFLNTRFGRRCNAETYCRHCTRLITKKPSTDTAPLIAPPRAQLKAFHRIPSARFESPPQIRHLRPRRGSVPDLRSLRDVYSGSRSEPFELQAYLNRPLPLTPLEARSLQEFRLQERSRRRGTSLPSTHKRFSWETRTEETVCGRTRSSFSSCCMVWTEERPDKKSAWMRRMAKRASRMVRCLRYCRKE